MRLAVRVTPKGGRDAIEGWGTDDAGRAYLKARVAAPPNDGAANAALLACLAKRLGRPRSSLRIVSGETSRLKMIEAEGLDEAAAEAVFGPRPPCP